MSEEKKIITIAHIDIGKTSLTAALTRMLAERDQQDRASPIEKIMLKPKKPK